MNRITPKLNRASAVDFADFDIEEPAPLSWGPPVWIGLTDGNQVETYQYDSVWFQKDNIIVNNYIVKDTVSQIK
jgi:hypothetical protein